MSQSANPKKSNLKAWWMRTTNISHLQQKIKWRHLKLFWFCIWPWYVSSHPRLLQYRWDQRVDIGKYLTIWWSRGGLFVDAMLVRCRSGWSIFHFIYLNRCKNSSIFFHVTPCRQSQETLWELRTWTILAHRQMWKTGVSSHVQHWHRLKMAAKENSPGEKLFFTGTWRPWFKGEIVNNKHPFSIRWIEGSIWKGLPFNLNILWFPLCHPTPFPAFVGG